MGKLTTHVLDTANGRPGAGMKVELSMLDGQAWKPLRAVTTSQEGRADLGELKLGQYRLEFHVGDYFGRKDFLDVVPVVFKLGEAQYHVPLLCSPWSYTTYRGS